jgi:hypothetical protein
LKRSQHLKCHRAIGLHIENARTVNPILFATPWTLKKRAKLVNGIGMANQQDLPGRVTLRKRLNDEVLTKTRNIQALD